MPRSVHGSCNGRRAHHSRRSRPCRMTDRRGVDGPRTDGRRRDDAPSLRSTATSTPMPRRRWQPFTVLVMSRRGGDSGQAYIATWPAATAFSAPRRPTRRSPNGGPSIRRPERRGDAVTRWGRTRPGDLRGGGSVLRRSRRQYCVYDVRRRWLHRDRGRLRGGLLHRSEHRSRRTGRRHRFHVLLGRLGRVLHDGRRRYRPITRADRATSAPRADVLAALMFDPVTAC